MHDKRATAERLFDEACEIIADETVYAQKELEQWSHQSPLHAKAAESALEIWEAAAFLDDVHWPTEEEVAGDKLFDAKTTLAHWKDGFVSKHVTWPKALAASIAALALVSTFYSTTPNNSIRDVPTTSPLKAIALNGEISYSTGIGENHLVTLPDGSRITIGGKSVVRTAYTDATRLVYLDQGEAYFDVAKDRSRPFIVDVGKARFEAVGTEFNVNRNEENAVMSVIEGVVRAVDHPWTDDKAHVTKDEQATAPKVMELKVGEQVRYSQNHGLGATEKVDIKSAISWRSGFLIFRGQTLGSIVSDINRYYPKKIIVDEDRIANLRFSGTVHTDSIESWIVAVQNAFDLSAIETDDGSIRLSPRKAQGA